MLFKSKGKVYGGEGIVAVRKAGFVAAQILHELTTLVEPGITTKALDDVALKRLQGEGVEPAFLGYDRFPAVLCTSVNEVAVHGVPNDAPLNDGDILKLDFGVVVDGYYSDTAVTVPVGTVATENMRLISVTEEALKVGIAQARAGNRVGDISAAIQTHVENGGFQVVRELTGHGIGKTLHEAPQVPNAGNAGEGPELRSGMMIAIEPITTFTTTHVKLGSDGFGYVTDDGRPAAHFEHTVLITEGEPDILTTWKTN